MRINAKVAVIISLLFDARVMEIPTPSWTAYDAKPFGVKMDKNVPMITQERATPRLYGIRRESGY